MAVFAISILVALACAACSGSSFIDKVVINNPTAYDTRIEISGQSRNDWTPLATIPANSQVVVQEVYDEGDTWVFRFGYLHFQKEIEVSRTQLAHDSWRITVPASFGSELEARGVTPPPS
jgi:hypothetical protein